MEAIDPAFIFSPNGRAYLITGGGLIHGTEVNPENFQPLSGKWFSLDDSSWKTLARGPMSKEDEIRPASPVEIIGYMDSDPSAFSKFNNGEKIKINMVN